MAIIKKLIYFGPHKSIRTLLQYFRINDPYRLLGLLVILAIIFLPFLLHPTQLTYPELKSIVIGEKVHEGWGLYTELITTEGPLAGWSYGLFDFFFGRSLTGRHIVSVVIIFLQAGFLALVFIDKKAFAESTFIPALIFVLLSAFSFDNLALSAELLGSGVLLLALNSLFKEIEFREQHAETTFNLGFFIGVASLFLFSIVIYLPASMIILALYTRASVQKFLLLVCGFILPHALLLSIFFLKGGLQEVWFYYYLPNFHFPSEKFTDTQTLGILAIVPLSALLVSLVMLNREVRFTKYQSQLLQAMFFWTVFSIVQGLFSKDLRPQSFFTLIPGLTFFITHFMLSIRRRRLAEINLWILGSCLLAVSYLARFGRLDSIQYESLFVKEASAKVKGKNILVLDNDISWYQHNRLGSPFFEWKITQDIFSSADHYENVMAVYEGFKSEQPDLIVDPQHAMDKFFDRIPALKRQYRSIPQGYEKISN